MKNYLKLLLPLAIIIIIAIAAWWAYSRFYKDKTTISFKTEEVILEDLTSSISASGTVEPEELINVGAQVSGKIISFGKDSNGNKVDYGSKVKAGTLLAQIDDELYQAAWEEAKAKKLQAEADISSGEAAIRQAEVAISSAQAAIDSAEANRNSAKAGVESAKAAIASAEAAIVSAQANVNQSEARLKQATRYFERISQLHKAKAIAETEFDSAEADFASAKAEHADTLAALNRARSEKLRAEAELSSADAAIKRTNAELERAKADKIRAEADLERAKANLQHAKAQLTICDAELKKAKRNLEYCRITAPVDGIIIDRRVSEGQTVVSSMNVSSIFLIAKDLKQMEVWVSVNEADIGHIQPGMPVEFTIDTFPGTTFNGTVKRVRLNATMSQNVVTYIVEVVTDNSDGKLIPYLTANVKFIRDRRKQVLTVSNAALRFKPARELIAPEYRDMTFDEKAAIVYVAEGDFLRPVEVKTGLRAAGRVELIDPPLKEGDVIVYGATEVTTGQNPPSDKKNSPFMPKPENNKVQGGGSAANRARSQGK